MTVLTDRERNVAYLRRSKAKQEMSLEAQLEWAIEEAARRGVTIDGTVADLKEMQSRRLSVYKGIYLDDSISGDIESRPGFARLDADVRGQLGIGAIFVYKRDRFARPNNPAKQAGIELDWRLAGATIVFLNETLGPVRRGEVEQGSLQKGVSDYSESREFLNHLAERIIQTNSRLAKKGFWTGGSPPYGFARYLVNEQGEILEKLRRGRTVRQHGCHVVLRPDPDSAHAIKEWQWMLDQAANGWGAKRIASDLNRRRVPSPDAGRQRRDRECQHEVTGKWSGRAVLELLRNPLIVAVQTYGRRSEGRHRRLGADGRPRNLHDEEWNDERVRLIHNSKEIVIKADVGFEPLYDRSKWLSIQDQLAARGRSQQGVPRAKDPSKYPLAGRVIDLTEGCQELMYGRTAGKRPMFTCGLYSRTAGSECHHNQVDADALLKFTLVTLRQLVMVRGGEAELRAHLRSRATSEVAEGARSQLDQQIQRLTTEAEDLKRQVELAKRRMTDETDDQVYGAHRTSFIEKSTELETVRAELAACRQRRDQGGTDDVDSQVQLAMKLFAQIERVVADPAARAEIRPLLKTLGLWIGLDFEKGIKGSKREVRILRGGIMTLGSEDPPVPLFGPRNRDKEGPIGNDELTPPIAIGDEPGPTEKSSAPDTNPTKNHRLDGGQPGRRAAARKPGRRVDEPASRQLSSHREGISFTKVNRGDRTPVELFLAALEDSPDSVRRVLTAIDEARAGSRTRTPCGTGS